MKIYPFARTLGALLFGLAATVLCLHSYARQPLQQQKPISAAVRSGDVTATFITNAGNIQVLLFQHDAPETVTNFIHYAQSGRYNDTIFHRVIHDFIIQGGGYKTSLEKIMPFPAIKNEASLGHKHIKGTLAMARLNTPNSAHSQFFFNMANNEMLNIPHGYTVFGQVLQGMELLERMNDMQTEIRAEFDQFMPHLPIIVKTVHINYH